MAKDQDTDIVAFILGLMFGVLGGAVLGILFAPKAGVEIQEDVQNMVRALPSRLNDEIKNPEGKTRGFFSKTRITLENQVNKVNKAIQAGKMAEAKKREEMASGYDYN